MVAEEQATLASTKEYIFKSMTTGASTYFDINSEMFKTHYNQCVEWWNSLHPKTKQWYVVSIYPHSIYSVWYDREVDIGKAKINNRHPESYQSKYFPAQKLLRAQDRLKRDEEFRIVAPKMVALIDEGLEHLSLTWEPYHTVREVYSASCGYNKHTKELFGTEHYRDVDYVCMSFIGARYHSRMSALTRVADFSKVARDDLQIEALLENVYILGDVDDEDFDVDNMQILLVRKGVPCTQSFSRYLKRYVKDEEHYQHILNWVRCSNSTLEFIRDTDELVEAYVGTYTDSCMAKELDDFCGNPSVHPATVYGDCEDIELAVMRNAEGDIISRALVTTNENNKLYGIVYGHPRLNTMLTDAGYRYERYVAEGCRLNKIDCDNNPGAIVMPYIDGTQSFRVDGLYVIPCESGEFHSDAEGICYIEPTTNCDCCYNLIRQEDAIEAINERGHSVEICQSCSESEFEEIEDGSIVHCNIAADAIDRWGAEIRISTEETDRYRYCSMDDKWIWDDNFEQYCEENGYNSDGDDWAPEEEEEDEEEA